MRRAKQVLNCRVVLGLLIRIADQQADGATRGLAFEHTGEDLDFIGLLALRGVAARAGLAAIQIELQVFQRELKPWRAAVNDSDQCRAVAFTSSGNSEQLAVGIAGHA